jgi:hypothetical protein
MTDLEIAAANFADADEMAAWAVGHSRQLAALDKAASKHRGFSTNADLRANSRIDPLDRNPYSPCWHWLGSTCGQGTPRLWTFDHDRGEKRSMSGPKAVFNISRKKGTGDGLAYRTCMSRGCVNPEHHAWAKDKAEIGAAIRADGRRKGTSVEQRRANVKKAWAATGLELTDRTIVIACRAAGPDVSHVELAARFGIHRSTVSMIRRGRSHREVTD